MHPGQRIMIIGCGGAGKSTLARRLGEITGLPVIHLDAEHWQPGWVVTPKEEWRRKVEALVRRDRWIIDGNYGGTLPIRMAAAETIIVLDYPWWLCLWRVGLRIVQYRGHSRPDIGPGCPERIDWQFIKWILDFPRTTRLKIYALLEEYREGKQILIHRSPGETRRWLVSIERVQP